MNVSLDSLKRVLKISQKDALKNTLEGIEESLKVGLKLKLNTVVVKSVNDDEILELLEYAKNRHIQIRYIEFMGNTHAKSLVKGLKEREILDLIAQKYKIIATEKPKQGSSKIYTLENGYQFGIIAPHSDDFCQSCNRIRLASDGKICPCLYYQDAIATMKKHNYDRSLYSQEEKDQLCVAVSTLMTLSAFLKVPIIDKDQKLQEKAKRALEIMKGQMDALESGQESGHYNVEMIQSKQKDFEELVKRDRLGI